jgi:phosphatidylglycerophosphatase A
MRLSAIISTVFGIGYVPFASGTVMSVIAVPFAILIARAGGGWAIIGASLVAFAIGVWATGDYVRTTGQHDPSECVIDELAGQWLACAGISLGLGPGSAAEFALAFLLFRLLDILKPWPISAAERLPGGWGVMTDDMVAGLFAGAIGAGMQYFKVM